MVSPRPRKSSEVQDEHGQRPARNLACGRTLHPAEQGRTFTAYLRSQAYDISGSPPFMFGTVNSIRNENNCIADSCSISLSGEHSPARLDLRSVSSLKVDHQKGNNPWSREPIQSFCLPTTEICFFRHISPTTRTCKPANPVILFICKLYPDANASKTCLCTWGGKSSVAVIDSSTSDNLCAPIKLLRLEVRWLFMTLEAIARPKAPPSTRDWSSAPLEMAIC